jgi:hypothetical protein
MAWLPGAGEEELLTMAGELVKTVEEDDLDVRILMVRWAEVNPKALLAWAKLQPPRAARWIEDFYVRNAIEAWARADFEGAWFAASAGHPKYLGDALRGLVSVNPEKCLALLAATNAGGQLGSVIKQLAAVNPVGVAALLDKATASCRNSMAGTLAKAWAEIDPAAAVAWMKTLPAGARDRSLEAAAQWIAIHAPDQVPSLLEGLAPGQLRACIEAAEFTRIAAQDPVAARRMIDEMPAGMPRQHARVALMQERLKAGDFQVAREMATQIGWHIESSWFPSYDHTITSGSSSSSSYGVGNDPVSSLKAIFSHIAAADPKEAAGILSLPGCESEVASRAALANPAGLAMAVTAMAEENGWTLGNGSRNPFDTESNKAPSTALQAAIRIWAARDLMATAEWVGAQSAGARSTPVLRELLFEFWARSDPAAMLDWASRHEGTAPQAWSEAMTVSGPAIALSRMDEFLGAAGDQNMSTLLDFLSTRPREAREVLRRMPDAAGVPVGAALHPWLMENPEEASAWVRSLPDGKKRSHATEEIVSWACQSKDFEAAFNWALTVPEIETRDRLLSDSSGSLLRENPEKAEALIRATLLPEDLKEKLLTPRPLPR